MSKTWQKGGSRFRVLDNRNGGKRKKLSDEGSGESDRRGEIRSNLRLKKDRISVKLHLQLTSLRVREVSLEVWILQIMVWPIITWEKSTMVHTVFGGTGPHLSHTCPTRHLKVQSYEDTCEVSWVTQKGNEFERQPSLSGLLEDTVRVYFVRLLRRYRSSSSCKYHTVLWRSPSRNFVCRSPVRNTR